MFEVHIRPSPLSQQESEIHERALVVAARYRTAEAALLKLIMEVDESRLYLKLGVHSTFEYVVHHLHLSEAMAYNFINVARKSREVPALGAAISRGELSISKARKIVPILTAENQSEWIPKATMLRQAELEREVAEQAPETLETVRVRPVRGHRTKLEFTISNELARKIRRVQELMGGRGPASLEAALEKMTDEFLERHDPLRKAERAKERKPNSPCSTPQEDGNLSRDRRTPRPPLPAALVHEINLRDKRKCQARKPDGSICGSEHHLEFHHIQPVSKNGPDTLENLITLCGQCHRRWHEQNSE